MIELQHPHGPFLNQEQLPADGVGLASQYRASELEHVDKVPPSLAPALAQLEELRHLKEDWNKRGAPAPNPESITAAEGWLRALYKDVENVALKWRTPHVTSDEEGMTSLDWTKGNKSLVLYLYPDFCLFVRAWGTDVDNEMEDGTLQNPSDTYSLYLWLLHD